jgi:predicted enzyme related to lactoylglutathione lyase
MQSAQRSTPVRSAGSYTGVPRHAYAISALDVFGKNESACAGPGVASNIMTRKTITATSMSAALVLAVAIAAGLRPAPVDAADPVETGRFVWHDLLTKDASTAKRFYGALLGWRFEDTKRGDRPYVLARSGGTPVAGIVDVSANASAGPQWLSYMSVADVDTTVAQVRSAGGKVLVEPRNLPNARAAVIADPQGAPLGLAQVRRSLPDPANPSPGHFFWDEYLARDAVQALDFYKRLAGYESAISESRAGVEYHVLRKTRARAGLFLLPPTATGVEPNWLPYVLVDDPAALSARVSDLGGRILLAAAPERRNGSVVVIADPGGAPIALQKFPF